MHAYKRVWGDNKQRRHIAQFTVCKLTVSGVILTG